MEEESEENKKNLETNSNNKKSKELTDEQKKELTIKTFKNHQIPNLILFGSAILFGVSLIIFSGFAWSLPLLLGLGFSIPSGLALVNSILSMKPKGIMAFIPKILRNCAWILGGVALITSGAIFCSGLVAASLITLGASGVVTGILKAIIGSQSDFLNTHREIAKPDLANKDIEEGGVNELEWVDWECWLYKAFNILAFIVTGILGVWLAVAPISLPFLPLVGIGIAALSVFGVVKSVLHLFLDSKASHVKCYKAAKYFKGGIFILGGAALIALTFLPISTALAGLIEVPAILLKIFCFAFGAFMSLKGGVSMTKNYSIVKCILASRECNYICKNSDDNWRRDCAGWMTPKIDGDITYETANQCFGEIK